MGTSYVKIGISNDPDRRLGNLQTGTPHDLELYASVGPFQPASLASEWEDYLHKHLVSRHIRGEWYWLTGEEVDGILVKLGWMEAK